MTKYTGLSAIVIPWVFLFVAVGRVYWVSDFLHWVRLLLFCVFIGYILYVKLDTLASPSDIYQQRYISAAFFLGALLSLTVPACVSANYTLRNPVPAYYFETTDKVAFGIDGSLKSDAHFIRFPNNVIVSFSDTSQSESLRNSFATASKWESVLKEAGVSIRKHIGVVRARSNIGLVKIVIDYNYHAGAKKSVVELQFSSVSHDVSTVKLTAIRDIYALFSTLDVPDSVLMQLRKEKIEEVSTLKKEEEKKRQHERDIGKRLDEIRTESIGK